MGTATYCALTSVVVVIAISIGLIASSLKKLSTEEAGLQYDVHQHKLKSKVYTAGLHAGPPGYKFIKFPRVYRTISFPEVQCLNKDGLTIELSVQFQYLASLKDEDLKGIIMEFKDHDNYKEVVQDAAQEVIHNTCSEFNVTEFQTSRVEFQNKILSSLQARLLSDFKTTVRDVQVSNIKRPSAYEKVVRDKEAAKQNIAVAEQERPRILTAANTKLKEAQTQANITLNKAHTDARIAITKANAEAEAIQNAYETEAKTYASIMIVQNLTVNGLLSYLSTRAVQTAKKDVFVNIDAPAKTSFP
ncbi:uncharacterized protein LOC130642109 [Hydractinia symbiolongicarpus]|uniref:uncharacterized protein LOC130642109 n=1 Tax=Hydractinia symbiolongicarpus TaxID=13093 RepID=UPI00255161E9|nr:uncharacterized protein LOC130642109 [Hydractinia symbiolongicarpus]